MDKTVTIDPANADLKIKIGKDYANSNELKFTLSIAGSGSVSLTMKFPVGKNGVLSEVGDAQGLTVTVKSPAGEFVCKAPASASGVLSWQLQGRGGVTVPDTGCKLEISVKNIFCTASAGLSEITFDCVDNSRKAIQVPKLGVNKVIPEVPKDGNPILYFYATPESLTKGESVTLSWQVAGNQKCTLLPINLEFDPDTSSYKDSPKDTVSYTLSVKGKPTQNRQFTINVLGSGWHPLNPIGADLVPLMIFDALPGQDYLYAIFKDPKKGPVLSRTVDGFRGWEVIDIPVPRGMETSPGVQLGNHLYLIGGSAANSDLRSDRIWVFDTKAKNSDWEEVKVKGERFGGRMGHACLVRSKNEIWVLGGIGEFHTLNDVWKLEIAEDSTPTSLSSSPLTRKADWDPRCMFGAVWFNNKAWIAGGVNEFYGKPLGDIYRSADGKKWAKRPKAKEENYIVAGAIGCSLVNRDGYLTAILTNNEGTEQRKITPMMFELQTTDESSDAWGTDCGGPAILSKDHPWISMPHSISGVDFKKKIYVRHLARTGTAPLYVHIS